MRFAAFISAQRPDGEFLLESRVRAKMGDPRTSPQIGWRMVPSNQEKWIFRMPRNGAMIRECRVGSYKPVSLRETNEKLAWLMERPEETAYVAIGI